MSKDGEQSKPSVSLEDFLNVRENAWLDASAHTPRLEALSASVLSSRRLSRMDTLPDFQAEVMSSVAAASKPYLDAMSALQMSINTPLAQTAAVVSSLSERMGAPAISAAHAISEQVRQWKDLARPTFEAVGGITTGRWWDSLTQTSASDSLRHIAEQFAQIQSSPLSGHYFSASSPFDSILSSNKASENLERIFTTLVGSSHLGSASSLESLLVDTASLRNSTVFRAMEAAGGTTLDSMIESSAAYVHAELARDAPVYLDEQEIPTVQSEIVQALTQGDGQAKLTPAALLFLYCLFIFVSGAYTVLSQWQDVREGICDWNDRIPNALTTAQARNNIRSFFCHMPISASARLRLVARDNVNLRGEPRLKSEVILTLDKYSILEVIDSTDRKWLQVMYKHDDAEIVGWVSRSMVRTISK
ncbi:SH3 domain-containing protein [Pseudomonas sp. NFR16]|uniref:SH3 domain-containing protein n=1 Tax=Pseudomonas sp. NFR16 TaxID=1566248 RepID=UPI0008B5CBD4|nr:SH3 domain-containing protein [Pseudomonas sp. NFR16]SEJ77283.1 SH3 domain-containing protein [Pseudomonas sp. NFR16]